MIVIWSTERDSVDDLLIGIVCFFNGWADVFLNSTGRCCGVNENFHQGWWLATARCVRSSLSRARRGAYFSSSPLSLSLVLCLPTSHVRVAFRLNCLSNERTNERTLQSSFSSSSDIRSYSSFSRWMQCRSSVSGLVVWFSSFRLATLVKISINYWAFRNQRRNATSDVPSNAWHSKNIQINER